MPLPALTKHVKIFANKSNKMAGAHIYTEKEFHAFLSRERFRVTRNSHVFSIAYFQLKDRNDTKSTNLFIKLLKKEIRSTDELGWFDGKAIGVFLYNTTKDGASYFVEKVNANTTMQHNLLQSKVYTYPSEWLSSEEDNKNNHDDDNNTSMNSPTEHPPEDSLQTLHKSNAQSRGTSRSPYVLPVWKRSLDIFAVLVGLILLSPFFLLLAIFIKIVSPGPIFFKQERIGLNGKPFIFWKFRTMKFKADASNHRRQMVGLIKGEDTDKPMTKQDDNPHIIPFGRILRKTCIDEFAQFINVLRGEMSLVGPRPPIPYEVEEYHNWHKERFNVLPGLTGLWQVSGKNRLTFNQMIRLDINYSRKISLLSDIKILLLTPFAILTQVKDSILSRLPVGFLPKLRVQVD
jgi:lipopolysaccharide/colanic/teichoic acid biosynthesis glycosyltransferase